MATTVIHSAIPGSVGLRDHFKWRLKKRWGQGHLVRDKLDDGFFITRSFLKSSRPFVSRFLEPGPMATFVFMKKGRMRVRFVENGPWLELNRGDACAFINSDQGIKRESPAHQEMEAVIIKISPEYLAAICRDLEADLPDMLTRPTRPVIRPGSPASCIMVEKIRQNRIVSKTDRLLARAGAIELVRDLFLEHEDGLGQSEIQRIRDLASFISTHVNRDYSLGELAEMTAMNRTKLNRLFRQTYGCTVFEYIRREKLRWAQHWLKNSDMDITEIAYAAGFCSSSHFSNFFRKAYGKAPGFFRHKDRLPISG